MVETKAKALNAVGTGEGAGKRIELRQVSFDGLMTDLIELDFAHACECERIGRSGSGSTTKKHVLNRLRELHRARREPYLRELTRVVLTQ